MAKSKQSILVLIIALALIAAIAAGILAAVDYITQKPRQEAEILATENAMKQLQPEMNNNPVSGMVNAVEKGKKWVLLPKGASKESYGVKFVTFYPAKKNGKLISVIAEAISPIGYGGNMTILVAVRPSDGAIQNVVVTNNKETPGLGTVVIGRTRTKTIWGLFEGKYKNDGNKLPPNKILDFFNGKIYVPNGKKVGPLAADKDVIQGSKWLVKKDGGDFQYISGATISSRAVTYGVRKIVSTYYDLRAGLLRKFDVSSK